MQRDRNSVRPCCNVARLTFRSPVFAICRVTGGGTKLADSQPISRQTIAQAEINPGFILEPNAKDAAHLKIRLICAVSRLGQRGHGNKPIAAAVGNVRPDKKISNRLPIMPIRKNHLVQQFCANGDSRRNS